MKLSKITKILASVTILSLIYINMQMKIIHLAYEGKNKEKAIKELTENNAGHTYNILKLKSSNNLGHKWLEENSDMEFLDVASVVSFEENQAEETKQNITLVSKSEKRVNMLLGFFSLRKAEAGIQPQE